MQSITFSQIPVGQDFTPSNGKYAGKTLKRMHSTFKSSRTVNAFFEHISKYGETFRWFVEIAPEAPVTPA